MSSLDKDENTGLKKAKQAATLSVDLLEKVKSIAEKSGANTDALTDKIDEIESSIPLMSEDNAPKKLDWIVLVGFVVFMVAMIGAVFGQNVRWLGVAFVIMPVVMLFGLFNNVKNMQPDWEQQGEDMEIYLPNAPQSMQRATGKATHQPQSKLRYWFVIIMVGLGALFFGAGGLFLLFSEYAADNF